MRGESLVGGNGASGLGWGRGYVVVADMGLLG